MPKCPYYEKETCLIELVDDALTLIQQLEFQNGELLKTVEMLKAEIEEYEESADKCCYESRCNAELNKLEALCKRLRDENEQLQAERDAAVADIGKGCFSCKHGAKELFEEPCNSCRRAGGITDLWQWRGVQKEEYDA